MKCKKLLSVLLAISVSVSTLAAATITASADGTKKTMNMGSGVIAVKDNIYYGNQKQFRVLSTNGSATYGDGEPEYDGSKDNASNALFVISENNFGNIAFDSQSKQMWSDSEAKKWCNELDTYTSHGFYTAAGITDTEKAAILTTSKTDAEYSYFKATSINDKVFYLSANEATTYFSDGTDRKFTPGGDDAVWWWLRSPHDSIDICVGFVFAGGSIICGPANNDSGVDSRPAFNLNLSSVLFTSAADFNGTVGEYTGKDWKLTLKDSTRSITTGDVSRSGDTLTVAYTGAKTGANEKVSYIITDKDQKEIKYYGSQAATSASGSVNITLPTMADTDKLFVFSEQDNGAMKTNYASELKEVTIPESAPEYTVAKATAPEGITFTNSVQSLKDLETETFDMRFFWTIGFNGNEAPTKLGAYFFDWEQFDSSAPSDSYAKIENNEIDETLTDGGIFFGTITGITNADKTYFAIPLVNDTPFADCMLNGTVSDTNIVNER